MEHGALHHDASDAGPACLWATAGQGLRSTKRPSLRRINDATDGQRRSDLRFFGDGLEPPTLEAAQRAGLNDDNFVARGDIVVLVVRVVTRALLEKLIGTASGTLPNGSNA